MSLVAAEGKDLLSYLAAWGSSSSGFSGKVTASQRPVVGPGSHRLCRNKVEEPKELFQSLT